MFAVSFHCWSEEESSFNSSDANIALNTYHPKKATIKHSVFHEIRENWTRQRKELVWSLSKENRERLHKLNTLLSQSRVLSILPLADHVLMFFSSGTLVSFSLRNNDIENIIRKDNFIKATSDPIEVAQLNEKHLVSLLSGSRISVVSPDLRSSVAHAEPLHVPDMPDNACVRTKRSFSAVYWSERIENGARGHLMIISHGKSSEIVARVPFNSLIQDVIFSDLNLDTFWLLEIPDPMNPTSVRMTLYVIKLNQGLKIVDELEIKLKSSVVVCELSPNEEKFVFGCSDNMLIVFDTKTHSAEHLYLPIRPNILCWHPGSHFLAVCSRSGELMLFDVGLSNIEMCSINGSSDKQSVLKLGGIVYSNHSIILKHLKWLSPTQLLVVPLVQPLALISLIIGRQESGALCLIKSHVKNDSFQEAIKVLYSINWNMEPGVAYASLTTICDALIVKPLNYTTETQLEAALASFYAPTRAINDLVVIEYRDHVVRYARRFLHHLLRHRRLQKAFLLATDIGAQDLFLDIHHMALHYKDFELASEASKKVDEMIESPVEEAHDERHHESDSEDDPPAIQRFMKHLSVCNSKRNKGGSGKPAAPQTSPESASTLKIKHFGFV